MTHTLLQEVNTVLPRQAELQYEELLVRIANLAKLNYGDVMIIMHRQHFLFAV